MNPKGQLTVVGSAALDTIQTPYGRVEDALGGSAVYIGAAGGFFSTVHVVAVVGNDFPLERLNFLRDRGVILEGIEVAEGPTFRWAGVYHRNMNQRDTMLTDLGVFADFAPALPDAARAAEYLILANIDPKLQLDVLGQMNAPRLVAFDTMNHWIEGNRSEVEMVLKKVDVVLVNDEEICQLTGAANPLSGAGKLMKMGPKCVVVKKGEHGSVMMGPGGSLFLCPAFPLEAPRDPTGAGDSFAGAMIGYLAATGDLSDYNFRRALVYGTVTASFTVSEFGTKGLENVTAEDIHRRFREFQAMIEF